MLWSNDANVCFESIWLDKLPDIIFEIYDLQSKRLKYILGSILNYF